MCLPATNGWFAQSALRALVWQKSPAERTILTMLIRIAAWTVLVCALCTWSVGQQGGTTVETLVVQTTVLSTAYMHLQYRVQLKGQGGITPLKWKLASGTLPQGMTLSEDGVLGGIPAEVGNFHFVVTVTDSSKPGLERNQELDLKVVAALLVEWSHNPKVSGARVDGSIKVSNQTGDDFDFTVIVTAVNEIGRATALGYQRFVLKKGTTEMEVPFGQTLPKGTYLVNVDAVGEVAVSKTIHKARLTDKVQVQQGP